MIVVYAKGEVYVMGHPNLEKLGQPMDSALMTADKFGRLR